MSELLFATGQVSETLAQIYQPHDKLFKKGMENPLVAREFFETHLPADLLLLLDFNSLQPVKETFITHLFENRAPDFIYEVKLKTSDNVLFLLCEQQSSIHADMAFRFLENTYLLMSRHRKQYPDRALPLVYPLLMYTGQQAWTAPKDIYGLFGTEETLARALFLKPYQLIDVCRTPDKILRQHKFSGLIEFALKYGEIPPGKAFFDILLPWMNEVVEMDGVRAKLLCNDIFFYLIRDMQHVTPSDYETLINGIRTHLSRNLQEDIMTFAQIIEQKGKEEATLKMAEKLLQEKALPLDKIAHFTGLSLERLCAMQARLNKQAH